MCSLNILASKSGRVTIPHLNKDLPKGTVKSILKQAAIAVSISHREGFAFPGRVQNDLLRLMSNERD